MKIRPCKSLFRTIAGMVRSIITCKWFQHAEGGECNSEKSWQLFGFDPDSVAQQSAPIIYSPYQVLKWKVIPGTIYCSSLLATLFPSPLGDLIGNSTAPALPVATLEMFVWCLDIFIPPHPMSDAFHIPSHYLTLGMTLTERNRCFSVHPTPTSTVCSNEHLICGVFWSTLSNVFGRKFPRNLDVYHSSQMHAWTSHGFFSRRAKVAKSHFTHSKLRKPFYQKLDWEVGINH